MSGDREPTAVGRRRFLKASGLGLDTLKLTALLAEEGRLVAADGGRIVASRLTGEPRSVILLFMMALTVVDVVARYVFNRPLRGSFEVTELLRRRSGPLSLALTSSRPLMRLPSIITPSSR